MSTGIVLQSQLTSSHRLVMFDQKMGKITVHVPGYRALPRLSSSMLCDYTLSSWRNTYFLDAFEITAFPAVSSALALQFIHQIFEILLAFMPVASPDPELFTKLVVLYTEQQVDYIGHLFQQPIRQRIFLCHILAHLGVYPSEGTYTREQMVRCLILSPFEFMVDEEDGGMDGAVNVWLQECLASHPFVHSWKTLK